MTKYMASKIPPRVAFFGWTTAMDKTLMMDNLRRQKYYNH